MALFDPKYPIENLKAAEYNPRKIDAESLSALRESLRIFGVAKPIIVSGNLIVAGHQRTKSLMAMGIRAAPAVILKTIGNADEIRFNQLHNGTDFDSGDEHANVGPPRVEPFQYEEVPAPKVSGNMRATLANIRSEICRLMERYGNWGACVATMSGEVIHAAQYALAAKASCAPVRTYRIPDNLKDQARAMLGRQYGIFSYDHLERKTYIQTFAQMYRLRPGRPFRSSLYDRVVIPELKNQERLLDFGCGQGDYVALLKKRGIKAVGVEFFARTGININGRTVHAMIDSMADDLSKNGLYDVVVCDSVLNSVDSAQAELDVLTCCNAFCRPGGRIYFSGRMREAIEGHDRRTRNTDFDARYVEFIDEHGLSGMFRNGVWSYQKFHREREAEALGHKYIGPAAKYRSGNSAWNVSGQKSVELPDETVRAAITSEFNLMWPAGKSVGRADQAIAAWEAGRKVTRQTASCGK